MIMVNLTVNGTLRKAELDPDMPLIYYLRNYLKLTGAKLGCGQEQCGACVVLVDGTPTNTCVRAVSEFDGREIITIEGLSCGGIITAVQQAFVDEEAAQCGYCIPGIIMATTALLESSSRPNKKKIEKILHNHLCRCGSQRRVLTAIEKLIKEAF